ncbi:MAG: response regulator, partial [Desulfobacterales bacterium]|nr:response regulator [Desulfobacterales bacterium]
KLYQIFSNLIMNAVKFTDFGSIQFGYNLKGDKVEFYVEDTGVGISDELKEKIFDRFVQAETDFTKSYDGAGLGLSISKGFLDLMGGDIWIDNKEVTRFVFTLPYAPSEKKVKDKGRKAGTEIVKKEMLLDAKAKILVVEDDEASWYFLSKILDQTSFEIIHASNGKEAVDVVQEKENIDLVLMDIKMPVMDGYEATKRIKNYNSSIPIVFQTAYSMDSNHRKAIDAGGDDFIIKPIRKQTLDDILLRYLIKE